MPEVRKVFSSASILQQRDVLLWSEGHSVLIRCPSVLLVMSGSEVSLKIQVEEGARENQVSRMGDRWDLWNLPLVFTEMKMSFTVTWSRLVMILISTPNSW